MEEQLNTMNAILQGMQQALKCNICLDMLSNPLTTKCGHSFCGECVQQLVKRPRGSAQCPLCMGGITRRSLSRNAKVTALVLAVRKVIASIKKDCCFEVTPSKYRPRPRPEAVAEDDDSENEEKDEPRRGTRKRGATALYNPEVPVPRPRPRPAKRRILAANGTQELSLHSEGAAVSPAKGDAGEGEQDILETIARDHSYSSPTKQAPLERPSMAPVQTTGPKPRGKARGGAAGHAPITYLGPRKLDEKNGDDLVSASQGDALMLPGEDVAEAGQPLPCLSRERPEDKVAKWLHNSREVGFRIGLTHSSSTPSTPAPAPADPLRSSGYPSTSLTSSGQQHSSSVATTSTTSRKFFKSKDATSGASSCASTHPTHSDSQDTFNFVSSQKTPPRQAPQPRRRGRGRGRVAVPAMGRVRGRGRGLARPSDASMLGTSSLSVSVQQSTPAGRARPRPPLEVSAIQAPVQESLIVRTHDDGEDEEEEEEEEEKEEVEKEKDKEEGKTVEDDDRAVLPDSCPVNTLDHFDLLVAETKENNPPQPAPPPTSFQEEEDKEAGLLFVTPAQEVGVEAAPVPAGAGGQGRGTQASGAGQDASHHHHHQPDKRPRGNSGGKAKKGVRQQVTEEAVVVEQLLEGVEDHQLAMATPQQEEESRQQRQQQREAVLREDLSLLSITHDNTMHNRSLAPTTTMAPPAPPSGRRRVRFDPNPSQAEDPTGRTPKKAPGARANTRYVSGMKQRLVESGRPSPVPVGLKSAKSTKSPGWSHVAGARKDLVPRNTSLNITGGEGRLGAEGRGRGAPIPSSVDSCLTIEDTQEFDVEHLSLSQTKRERVQRLRDIVSSMTKPPLPTHTPTHSHAGQEGTKEDNSTVPDTQDATEHLHDTTENVHTTTEDAHNTMEDTHNNNNNNDNTETLHNKSKQNLHTKIPSITNHKTTHSDTDTNTHLHTDTHPDSIILGKSPKQLKLSLQRLIPKVEKIAQKKPYIVKDTEREIASLSPRARHTPQSRPVMKRKERDSLLPLLEKSSELKSAMERVSERRGAHGKSGVEKESGKATSSDKNEAVVVKDYDRENHSGKPNAVVPMNTDTEPFDDDVHSKDTAEQEKQNETTRITPQQESSQQVQKMPPPQQGKHRAQQQGKQDSRTHTTTSKRKQRDPSPQQEKEDKHTQPLTQQGKQADHPPGKRIKQAASTDSPQSNHSTDSDTAKPHRKTFSFSTDTEDLDALLDHPPTDRDSQQHSRHLRDTAGSTTAPQRDSRRAGRSRMSSLASNVDNSSHSKPQPPHHTISPSMPTTTATEDTIVALKQGAASGSSADKVTTASQVSRKGSVTSGGCDSNVTSRKGNVTSEEALEWSAGAHDPQNLPHHSSLVTLGADEEGQVMRGPVVVPFKAVGPLCSERCLEAGVGAGVVPSGVLRDLCVHSVPCEVYQVLMRYMDLLNTQPPQHRMCCGKGVPQQQQQQQSQPQTEAVPPSQPAVPPPPSAPSAPAAPAVPAAPSVPATEAASQPQSSCTQASQSSGPAMPQTQAARGAREVGGTQVLGGDSEPLFESEVVQSSCLTQDMALALPLPVPLSHTSAGKAQKAGPGRGPSACSSPEPRTSQGQEVLSEDILLQPEALMGRMGQPATTEASQESVSLLANCEAEEALGPREAEQHEGRGPEKAERRAVGSQRGKERVGASQRAASGEVEKENVQSVGGQPLTRGLSLRRKPQKVGRPVLEDILTQRGGQGEVPSSHKASLPPTAKPMFSPDPGRGRGQRDEAPVVPVASDQAKAKDRDSEASGPEDSHGRPPKTRLSGRKRFRRIARPPSSSSESEGEAVPAPTLATNPDLPRPASPALTQHLLDSEEMRDLERLDRNVWEEFGRPDDDTPEDDPLPPLAGRSPPTTTDATPRSAITLTASTRRVVERANNSLAKVEEFLGPASMSQPHPMSPSSPEVTMVQATDDEEEEEEVEKRKTGKEEEEEEDETQSHGSTQSEGISTQKQKQMKDEIEALRRKKEEVMAALGNKKKEEQGGVDAIIPSQVDSLVSTCPFTEDMAEEEEMEGDQDLFPSNPGGDDLPSPPPSPQQPPPPPPPASPPPPTPARSLPRRENQPSVVQRIPRAQLTSSGQSRGRGGAKTRPCAVFSGLGLVERRRIQESLQTLEKMGLGVRANWGPEVTHIVVQTKDNVAPRTLKYLLGVAAGCWVVSQKWVMDSLARGKLMPEELYEVLDETGEEGPRLSRTSHSHLLEGCQVCLVPPFEDMTPEQVKELAEISGARVVQSPKMFSRSKNILTLLLIDSDREEEGKEMMARHGRVAVGHNWLVDSITCHRLVSLPEHLLGTPSNAVMEASGVPPGLMVESQSME